MKPKVIFKIVVFWISAIQISFLAQASKGLILNQDGNLNYYENDKFVKRVNHFKDIRNDFISIHFNGDYYYLVKKYKNLEKYYLERWNIKTNKSDIINLNASNSPIKGLSLVSKGSGYIQTKEGYLDYYLNGDFIHTLKLRPLEYYEDWVSFLFTGNALYQNIHFGLDSFDVGNAVYKCSKSGDKCKSLDIIGGDLSFMDLNQNGNGLFVSKYWWNDNVVFLQLFRNNIGFNIIEKDIKENFSPISVTSDDYIYFQLNTDNKDFSLNKCDLDFKNCSNLDLPDKDYVYVSFK